MMGRNRSESGGNGAALDDSSITPVQKLVSCTSVLLLNGHSEEKNTEETVSREDTGGDIHTTRSWYPTIHRKRAIRIKAQERAQSSIATTTDDDDKDTDAKFRANLHRLERFYSGTTTIDAESATGGWYYQQWTVVQTTTRTRLISRHHRMKKVVVHPPVVMRMIRHGPYHATNASNEMVLPTTSLLQTGG